ncbi:MAG: hypothetical protein WBA46_09270 [Thermomicrobiales bacterium]
MTEVATSGWIRPQPESVVGFAILFLLFVLSGYVVHAHIRARRLHWLKTGIVGLLFTIAIGYGFATGLWLVDRVGLYAPYASRERDASPGAPDREPPFTVEQPALEPPFPVERRSPDSLEPTTAPEPTFAPTLDRGASE